MNALRILFVVFIMLCYSVSMACDKKMYNVYYTPLEAQFYVPLTREDIIDHAVSFEINSSNITCLFKSLSAQNSKKATEYDYNGFRIIIQDIDSNIEIIITTDKTIFLQKMIYNVDTKTLDSVLKEIKKRYLDIKKKNNIKKSTSRDNGE